MMKMQISQSDMRAAIEFWLNEVVLKESVVVSKVELDRGAQPIGSSGVDHFILAFEHALEAEDAEA